MEKIFLKYNNQQRCSCSDTEQIGWTSEMELPHCIEHLTERQTYRKSAVVTLVPSWIQAGFRNQAGEMDVK